jgi:putative hydrolase of the HAD superfamily
MSDIQAVITDFGGVLTTPLLDSFTAIQDSSGISMENLGLAMMSVAQRLGVNPLVELETGRMKETDFLRELGGELSDRLGRPVEMHTFGAAVYEHLQPNRRMIDYMRQLRERGYRLAICTNNVREWEARWRSMLPVDELFEVVVDSAFVGMRKPDPEIYQFTLERLHLPAQAALFIDDVELNCDGARQAGMDAIRFRDTEQAISEVEQRLGQRD